MKHISQFTLLALLFATFTTHAQQRNFKFDFGTKTASAGYLPVSVNTIYTDKTGYGFINSAGVSDVSRGTKKNISSDFVTGSKPFFFSVKVPEGNYDVKIILGDVSGTSATTVRAECRRLFLPNIRTKKGEIKTEIFTVHVKDSFIRDQSNKTVDKVKLKEREINYRHWDNQLTLEFNDSAAKICAIEITPNTRATTVFLSGNSTVVDQDREPWAS